MSTCSVNYEPTSHLSQGPMDDFVSDGVPDEMENNSCNDSQNDRQEVSTVDTVSSEETRCDSIYSYMRIYAAELGQRILEKHPPLYAPGDPSSPHLDKLLRRPLPAQQVAIMGLSKWFVKNTSGNIVGECGTGKSFMSVATAYVHADGKPFSSLVMCPPHLVLKWAREVFQTLPGARCFVIDDMRNGGSPTSHMESMK